MSDLLIIVVPQDKLSLDFQTKCRSTSDSTDVNFVYFFIPKNITIKLIANFFRYIQVRTIFPAWNGTKSTGCISVLHTVLSPSISCNATTTNIQPIYITLDA